MKKENIFYLIFILTILAIRTGVFFFPQRKIIIDGVIIHHFWIGIILISLALLLAKRYSKLKRILFPLGLAAMADELVYIAFGGATVSDYWMNYSVFGAIILSAIIFFLRKKIALINE